MSQLRIDNDIKSAAPFDAETLLRLTGNGPYSSVSTA
ncbi:MAG: hypothetical protein JWP49_712 [Phenylobacterium sp.]|jgi:hypothetical protein|nr:hypothetical protein [Phenylobacterium sp.]